MTLKDKYGTEVAVTNNQDKHQFEISYPEDAVTAGFAAYLDNNDSRIFYHTVVGDEFSGKGLASILVAEALEATKEAGLTVVPVCPFVKGFVEKNGFEGYRKPNLEDLELVKSQA
ncbi:acetyltransferase [Corynebacterium suranareeae]|uniref:Acetyltransferase n=1 Tax=Corynebacterium suranareeae TaxID=2506452 RepID=A0A160PSK3_9CORY|nr:GNAT family N-acetyltransferase [Corynebacterium suranareeae]BAU96706.1 acetyltransferase [Corynebacterium suranareeae]